MFAGLVLLSLAPMRETYTRLIVKRLEKKAKRGFSSAAASAGSDSGRCWRELVKHMVTVVLLLPLHMLVTEPVVGLYSLYNAFTLATLYGFFCDISYRLPGGVWIQYMAK